MYIEDKSGGVCGAFDGAARIGRVSLSKTGKTLYYAGLSFQSLKGHGYKTNHFETSTGARFWISGPRKDGQDSLYPLRVEVDEDVRDEYWRDIRSASSRCAESSFRSEGKHHKSSKVGDGKVGAERPSRRRSG
jgi:hypothetical protein